MTTYFTDAQVRSLIIQTGGLDSAPLTVKNGSTTMWSVGSAGGLTVGTGEGLTAGVKNIVASGTTAVAVPSITDPDIAKVDVDVSAMTFVPAIGDAVIPIPLVALPTNARLQGAWVSATDTVTVVFGSEGGNVVGASKNFNFLFFDLT